MTAFDSVAGLKAAIRQGIAEFEERDVPTFDVVDANGEFVSGPWFKDQAERLAKRGWADGLEHFVKERQ